LAGLARLDAEPRSTLRSSRSPAYCSGRKRKNTASAAIVWAQRCPAGVWQKARRAQAPAYIAEREIGRRRRDARSLARYAAIASDLDGDVSIHALDRGTKTNRGRRCSEDTALRHILDVLEPGLSS
jgi:hypothetical protein